MQAFDKPEDRLDPQVYYHAMPLSDVQNLITEVGVIYYTGYI